jgi:hypothetical protein
VNADDVNIRGDNRYCKEKHRNFNASKEVGLEEKAKKTKYMLLSRHQNAEQNHDIKIGNRCFENVAQFRYFGNVYNNSKLDSGRNLEVAEFG